MATQEDIMEGMEADFLAAGMLSCGTSICSARRDIRRLWWIIMRVKDIILLGLLDRPDISVLII